LCSLGGGPLGHPKIFINLVSLWRNEQDRTLIVRYLCRTSLVCIHIASIEHGLSLIGCLSLLPFSGPKPCGYWYVDNSRRMFGTPHSFCRYPFSTAVSDSSKLTTNTRCVEVLARVFRSKGCTNRWKKRLMSLLHRMYLLDVYIKNILDFYELWAPPS
jgi:hypothetical protein